MVHRTRQGGQISFLIALMLSTFVLLFAFVVNTGMLIHAKINLQNAADLAAYAGAAVQARQLNSISFLNYEMRRQWKKFLFRLYIIGNMAQDHFPRTLATAGGGPGTPMTYRPNLTDPTEYFVPTTCIIFDVNNNVCHLASLPGIQLPPMTYVDSITDTLRGQLQAIEQIRQNNCKAIGMTNIMLNLYWLYNTDPFLTQLKAPLGLSADQTQVLTLIQTLATGLGIVPREMILKFRIRTLEGYVNTPAQKNLTWETAQGLKTGSDPVAFERSLQAFLSAYYTLGNHLFPQESVVMEELLPHTLLQLKEMTEVFDTFAIDMNLQPPPPGSQQAGSCQSQIIPVSVNRALPVGFYKDPQVLTYYALRLKAKAKLLFSPFRDLDMTAYAAAMPFGSRIGPPPSLVAFTAPLSQGPPQNRTVPGPSLMNRLPNLPLRLEESGQPSQGMGWDTQEAIAHFFKALAGTSAPQAINGNAIETAYQTAMAPNPWEQKYYNIPTDGALGTPGPDPFVRHYDQNQFLSLWAPLFPPSKATTTLAEVTGMMDELFNDQVAGNLGASAQPLANLKATLSQGLQLYIDRQLRSNQGENNEGLSVARLQNPLSPSIVPTPALIAADVMGLRTSWPGRNDAQIKQAGRIGYSVKFISFKTLQSQNITTNGSQTWNNRLVLDPQSESDLPFIQH